MNVRYTTSNDDDDDADEDGLFLPVFSVFIYLFIQLLIINVPNCLIPLTE